MEYRKTDFTKSNSLRQCQQRKLQDVTIKKRTWFFNINKEDYNYYFKPRIINKPMYYYYRPIKSKIELLQESIKELEERKELSTKDLQFYAKKIYSNETIHIKVLFNIYHLVDKEKFIEILGYIPYDILTKFYDKKIIESSKMEEIIQEGINLSLIRRDLYHKKYWMTREIIEDQYKFNENAMSKSLPEPICFFSKFGNLIGKFKRRNLTFYENLHYSHPIEKRTLDISELIKTRAIVETISEFKRNFRAFTDCIFDDIYLHNAFIGGSCIPACLTLNRNSLTVKHKKIDSLRNVLLECLPLPLELKEIIISMVIQKKERKLIHKIQDYFYDYSTSDIDIFITANTRFEAFKSIEFLYNQITNKLIERGKEFKIIRSNNAITICSGYPIRNIQLVLLIFQDIREHLNFADMDCTSVVFDGKNVIGSERAIRSYNTRYNFLPPSCISNITTGNLSRIKKYISRSFNILFYELCKHQPRCDCIPTKQTFNGIIDLRNRRIRNYNNIQYDSYVYYNYGMTLDDIMNKLHKTGESLLLDHHPNLSNLPWIIGDKLSDVITMNDILSSSSSSSSMFTLKPIRWKREEEKKRNLFLLPRCYMCKTKGAYFEQQKSINRIIPICDQCKLLNEQKIDKTINLSGKIALITGGRIKIGYSCALRLLRCGALVIITSRFPYDCNNRFKNESDYFQWKDQIHIYGVDFRHLESVNRFISHVKEKYKKLDILINNAAQTIHRPPAYYEKISTFELNTHQLALQSSSKIYSLSYSTIKCVDNDPFLLHGKCFDSSRDNQSIITATHCNSSLTSLPPSNSPLFSSQYAMIPVLPSDNLSEDEKLKLFPDNLFDEHNEPIDLRKKSSWNSTINEIHPIEMIEVQLVNSIVPSLFISNFYDLLKRTEDDTFIINVTSTEGQFSARKYNGHHAHTNMAKASLNMLTLSVAENMVKDRIYVNSVDTGWVTKMTPAGNQTARSAIAPLTPDDGAARILDPIFNALLHGIKSHGKLFKDFVETPW